MTDLRHRGGYSGPPPTTPPPDTPAPSDPDGAAGEPLPAPRRERRGPRSLTAKLVFGVVALVIVLVGVIGAATYYSLRSFLSDKLDQQLATTVNQGGRSIFYGSPPNGPTPLEVYATALDPDDGAVIAQPAASSERVEAINLSEATARRLFERESPEPVTIDTTDGRELRVTVRDGYVRTDGVVTPARIVIGLSTSDEHSTLRQLILLELIIGGAAVVLALVATTAGVRFSLRRLRRVTLTAQEVATELSPEGAGLERRVPDDEPDTEVGQLATSFNMMLAAVETQFAARLESEQRMRQFLADASHELRTPLTSIRGYAELARMQRASAGTAEDSSDNLDRIEFEGTRMSRLVEDLLLLARGDGSDDDRPMERQLIDVAQLLDDSVSGARAAYPDREIALESHDAHLVGDPDQLLRVVRNLINNAAVHTAPERPIRVRSASDDDGVSIQVIDGGPGLPPDEAAHVFERFWRADKARTRARGGSGLGLSIVASIVRSHGGTVRFDSSVEGGSTVTVRLPGVEAG